MACVISLIFAYDTMFVEKTVKTKVLFRLGLKIICKVLLEKAILRKVLGKAALRKVMRVRVCSAKATEASIGYEKWSKPMAN